VAVVVSVSVCARVGVRVCFNSERMHVCMCAYARVYFFLPGNMCTKNRYGVA